MVFDITSLDKRTLVKCLFSHSDPVGLGVAEYKGRKFKGENVIGLTEKECESYLYDFEHNFKLNSYFHILDYCKGKPIKLGFLVKNNGRILVDTKSYDERNGLYRSFEALLCTFLFEEIKIVKKGYSRDNIEMAQKTNFRPKEHIAMYKSIVNDCLQIYDSRGKYLAIDETKSKEYNKFLGLDF